MRDLISIEDLEREDIERILDRARSFTEVSERQVKKVPALRGRRVLNLFYEASTRTRSSFELAAKSLSADVINFAASGSAVEKGESLKDTIQTLSAYQPDLIVVRTPHVGAAELIAGWTTAGIVNAGDGKHEHPTQALLDVYTLRERLGALDGLEHLDRRRRHALARGALVHPRLHAHGREGDGLRPADADPARDRGAWLRGRLHARRHRRRRRRLRAADAARADGRLLRPEPARVRRRLPDRRAPASARASCSCTRARSTAGSSSPPR